MYIVPGIGKKQIQQRIILFSADDRLRKTSTFSSFSQTKFLKISFETNKLQELYKCEEMIKHSPLPSCPKNFNQNEVSHNP